MDTTNRITVEQASKVLGISPHEIRYHMRMRHFDPPIGQTRKSRSGKSYRYDVYKNKVMAYAGITEWPE